MFLLISVIVPVLVYLVASWIVEQYHGDPKQCRWLLLVGCVLFFISWYLPSPLIDGQNTSFTTHFVGGGLFAGLVWLYFKYSLKLGSSWWLEGFSLFALVCALGCINELFELTVVQVGLVNMSLNDTSWDILANSLGALVVYAGYLLYDSWHR